MHRLKKTISKILKNESLGFRHFALSGCKGKNHNLSDKTNKKQEGSLLPNVLAFFLFIALPFLVKFLYSLFII